jgi:hypothetical protein
MTVQKQARRRAAGSLRSFSRRCAIARGFALFNRPDKGNCAGRHPSTRQAVGSPPAFTDYTYELSDAEIDDLAAFLSTLTDGYDPVTDSADPARNTPTN